VFRTVKRLFLPNGLDWICRRAKRRQAKRVLLAWNRGLGDIALGLYAIVYRIREWIPDAEITFLIRANLQEGFTLLKNVQVILAPSWVRGQPYDVDQTLIRLGRLPEEFDLIIEWPNPTEWVSWQYGQLVPRLTWNSAHEELYKKFDLPPQFTYIGVQAVAETQYGLWRNWPHNRWCELFEKLRSIDSMRIILFGLGAEPKFQDDRIIDLRGKTTLFELLSLIKNRCRYLIAPDSGILSTVYYLDTAFSLQIISLWADPKHGILKQNVASPNPLLIHRPLIGEFRDLSTISVDQVLSYLLMGQPHAR